MNNKQIAGKVKCLFGVHTNEPGESHYIHTKTHVVEYAMSMCVYCNRIEDVLTDDIKIRTIPKDNRSS